MSGDADAPRIAFSYAVFWTKQARQWDTARQTAMLHAVRAVLRQPGFEPNAYARRYSVPGLDDAAPAGGGAHAGASLVALEQVLAAFLGQSAEPPAQLDQA